MKNDNKFALFVIVMAALLFIELASLCLCGMAIMALKAFSLMIGVSIVRIVVMLIAVAFTLTLIATVNVSMKK